MSDRVDVHVEGGEALMAAIVELGLSVRRELRQAGRAGAEVIRQAAEANAPGPHIEIDVVSATGEQVVIDIGPDADHWHYRFAETGAAPHEIRGNPLLAFAGQNGLVVTRRVSHPGMAARPFLRPAHDGSRTAAADEFGAALRERIEEVRA